MIKRLIKTLMTFLAFSIVISCSNQNDWSRFALQGKVKSTYEKYYEAEQKFGEWQAGDINYWGHNKISFDNSGRFMTKESFDEDGELRGKYVPSFVDGDIIEGIEYDDEGDLLTKYLFEHISANEIKITTYNNEGEPISYTTEFLKDGRTTKSVNQNRDNEKTTIEFIYDKNGDLTTQVYYLPTGEKILEMKYEYLEFDKNGNWTKRLDYNLSDTENPENIVIRDIVYY